MSAKKTRIMYIEKKSRNKQSDLHKLKKSPNFKEKEMKFSYFDTEEEYETS